MLLLSVAYQNCPEKIPRGGAQPNSKKSTSQALIDKDQRVGGDRDKIGGSAQNTYNFFQGCLFPRPELTNDRGSNVKGVNRR